jgi:hypothetical protein
MDAIYQQNSASSRWNLGLTSPPTAMGTGQNCQSSQRWKGRYAPRCSCTRRSIYGFNRSDSGCWNVPFGNQTWQWKIPIYIYTYIDFPTRALIYRECSIAMFDYQSVTTLKYKETWEPPETGDLRFEDNPNLGF